MFRQKKKAPMNNFTELVNESTGNLVCVMASILSTYYKIYFTNKKVCLNRKDASAWTSSLSKCTSNYIKFSTQQVKRLMRDKLHITNYTFKKKF